MRPLLVLILALGVPGLSSAQEPADTPADTNEVRPGDEIPKDMPPPPEDAPPAEAPAVDGTDERPPHPKTPAPLSEEQPTAATLAKTSYHWLPGHWVWTGKQFEWKSGEWIYQVKDMILVPPRWEWDRKQWVFHNAGWAEPGSNEVVYRPTPAPGGPDVVANAERVPAASTETVEPQRSTTTVYVWTGVYVPPLILFPVWHPWYHYHWYHRHAYYYRPPAYHSHRYHYAHTHRPPSYHPGRPPHHGRPPSHGGGSRPSTRPSTRPSQPSTRPSTRPSRPPSTRPSHRGGARGGRRR